MSRHSAPGVEVESRFDPPPPGPAWDGRTWQVAVLRAGTFAAASVGLAVTAHRLAGGEAPRGRLVIGATALLFLLGLALSRRERGGFQVTALVLVTQALLHLSFIFSAMAVGTPIVTGRSVAPMSAAEMARMLFCFPRTVAPSSAQLSAALAALHSGHVGTATASAPRMMCNPFSTAGLLMLGAHLVAATAMAWWLRRGERAAWTALRRVITTLRSFAVAVTVVSPPVRVPVDGRSWRPTQRVWGAGLAGRGPPRGTWPTPFPA